MTHKQRKYNIYSYINRAIKNQWTVPFSSDGYANYGTGDRLTGDGYGANGFGNPNAWLVLSKIIVNQQYQFCLQNDGYMGLRLKYSKLGFNSGTGELIQVPSATDEEVLLGSGTDTVPVYQQVMGGILNFNPNSAFIKILTSTNELNFNLIPKLPTITNVNTHHKPVINKILG